MIFHFDFGIYRQMVRLALKEQDARLRRRQFLMLFVLVPIVSTIHAICFFLDRIVFPELTKVEVRTPVFVVGHARSGTTLLHRIMSEDGDRFSCFRLYECFFPSVIEKKVIRLIGRLDQRVLGGRIEQRIRDAEQRRLRGTQDIHRTGLFEIEEDDFSMAFSCASGFWIVMFPYMGELDFYYIDEWTPRRRRQLMNFYREVIRRQLYLNGTDRIHLSKNPTFSGRVESLIEAFPDARIVVCMRNPYETIPSLLKLLQVTWRSGGWDDERIDRSLRVLGDQSLHTYRHPLAVLERHPSTPQAIVDYRELVAEPKAAIEAVYKELGFEVSEELAAKLEATERRARSHDTTHSYSLEEFGLRADHIRGELAELFERFHWEDDGRRTPPGIRRDSGDAQRAAPSEGEEEPAR